MKTENSDTGRQQRIITGHTNSVYSAAFNPDGKTLASGSEDETAKLWNVKAGNLIRTFHSGSEVNNVAFSPDGQTLAVTEYQTHLWHIPSGNLQQTLYEGGNVTFSPDWQTLASPGSYQIELKHVVSEKTQQSLRCEDAFSVAFSPDGNRLASGQSDPWGDNAICLWDLSTQVSITPSSIESPAIGEKLDVDINIASGQDIRGYRINVEYNSTLRYVSHTLGDYLPDDVFIGPTETESSDRVSLNVTSAAGAGNGDGTLATITFEVVAQRASTFALSVILSNSNGKRFPAFERFGSIIEPSWDVNYDRVVNILDMSFVAARFGQNGQTEADVNRDGVVDIKDLILVASGMDTAAAAPTTSPLDLSVLPTKIDVQQWFTQAQQLNLTDATSQRDILFLEQLLAALTPRETALLPNYPNPFNPET